MQKTWRLRPHDEAAIRSLAKGANVSPLVAQLLLNRGIATAAEASAFLQPSLKNLREPEELPGVEEAADRVFDAVREGRPICVYGDYDVDGVAGTAILVSLLRVVAKEVHWHIPHRIDDGYGLNVDALRSIARRPGTLVITVDCGIGSLDEAAEAKRLGLELIVTDHHQRRPQLPDAAAIVHPALANGHGSPSLCGAGVALKLAWAVGKRISGSDKVRDDIREILLDAVALATMGTVADVMPLLGENRTLVRYGLARMQQGTHTGIRALMKAVGLDRKDRILATDIAYVLAPRLNAAGRLETADIALQLLLCRNPSQADALAETLDRVNAERRRLEQQMLRQAHVAAAAAVQAGRSALVLADPDWHPGLIGIVAGRLSEAYGRPALMIAGGKRESIAFGSGRSIPGLPLHEALQECGEHLESHGGHAAAAGFRIRPEAIAQFREQFIAVVERRFGGSRPEPELTVDAEVPLAILSHKTVAEIGRLEPFGHGNPPPLFLATGLEVEGEPRLVGEDRHLSFRVRQGQTVMKAIAFNMADRREELLRDAGRCSLVFTPYFNHWQGMVSVELMVRDLRPGERAEVI